LGEIGACRPKILCANKFAHPVGANFLTWSAFRYGQG
jgi:hypothetical protein